MMTIGDEWAIMRHDEEIQGIFDEWCELWGDDDLPVLELLGGETLEMYRERLKKEFAERKANMK